MFVGILSALMIFAVLIPVGAQAYAAPTPVTDPLGSGSPNGSITLPSNRCPLPAFTGFMIDVGVVANREYQDVTTRPDGTIITNIRGLLVLRFTNDSTGYTIVKNLSGPTTTITNSAGTSGTEVGGGNNWWSFGPKGQANTHEPGLVFTSGFVTITFANGTALTFSLHGHQENGCTLLS